MNQGIGLLHASFSLLQELARKLRPNTLRARFGKTKIQNAVHCTDLPEDGLLEVISSVANNLNAV
jgi:nucleoside diphosphate kinase